MWDKKVIGVRVIWEGVGKDSLECLTYILLFFYFFISLPLSLSLSNMEGPEPLSTLQLIVQKEL